VAADHGTQDTDAGLGRAPFGTVPDAVRPGVSVTYRRTISESEVLMFADATGDHAPAHVDEGYAATTRFGGRIAHGVLLLGLSSTATWEFLRLVGGSGVSYGYDRVRFTSAVRIGETLEVTYTCREVDHARGRSVSDITITAQDGRTCMVAQHILAYL
jgi:3-hydroxybutyryl-CoA dehydratase